MSKETRGFLRKVVRFVSNPTTDWAELDTPSAPASGNEYAKAEIKAMIERKRRNDFVRKRELDMLRKIRREGLSPDQVPAQGSNFDADSRLQNGARSDMAVKAKIDAIELQMVGSNTRASTLGTASTGKLRAGRPNNQQTTQASDLSSTIPNPLSALDTRQQDCHDPTPAMSQAAVQEGPLSSLLLMAAPSPLSSARPPSRFPAGLEMSISEVAHDPELDEAVMAFANADFAQCERCLLDLIQPGAARHEHSEAWLALFDLYRTLDLPQKFERLAVSYAQKFGLSAPQWFSYPKKVADFLASTAANTAAHASRIPKRTDLGPDAEPAPKHTPAATPALNTAVWTAPQVIDLDVVTQLHTATLQMPHPWAMDWRGVVQVTPEGASKLGLLMRQWGREQIELIWVGAEHLMLILGNIAPSGTRDADPAYWMLRLDILRLCNRPVQFDEVAIDYCVTYELSPPSWEPAACHVRMSQDAINPATTRSLSYVGEVTTTFVESQLRSEVTFLQVATLSLSGQLVGDIGPTLKRLDTQLGSSVSLEINCEHLLRLDFIAAGDLLNWVLARRAEHRQVLFNSPHRLIAHFFGAMGITEHATVKLRAS